MSECVTPLGVRSTHSLTLDDALADAHSLRFPRKIHSLYPPELFKHRRTLEKKMTDYEQRQRIITELAADGGLGADKVATEVLFYLPPDFLVAYENLFWRTFKPQGSVPVGTRGGGIGKDTVRQGELDRAEGGTKGRSVDGTIRPTASDGLLARKDDLSSLVSDTRDDKGRAREPGSAKRQRRGTEQHVASSGGKKYKEFWVIISDKNYRRKLRVDAKLKKLGREISGLLADDGKSTEGSSGSGICSGCKRFTGKNDKFCSNCGTKLTD